MTEISESSKLILVKDTKVDPIFMSDILFPLQTDFIELAQLLKAVGLCESGGSAKQVILRSQVQVDGRVELRKGRKIRRGQLVECFGQRILVQ